MFGNHRRWLAAALAGGLLAFVWTGGAVAQHQHGQQEQHDHAQEGQAEESHDHAAMDHDAEPTAVEPGQPAKTLSPDALDAPAETSVREAQRSAETAEEMSGGGHEGHGGHGGHGTSTYRQVDAGRAPEAHQGHEGHEGHETAKPQPQAHDHDHGPEAAATYVCPMHPEVTSATPGKCSKCGMDLVPRRKE